MNKIAKQIETYLTQQKKRFFKGRLLPLPKAIKKRKDCYEVSYGGGILKFQKYENIDTVGWIQENFVEEQYKQLSVSGKNVIDLGSSMGDTAIYFICKGAYHVYGYEIEKTRFEASRKNVEMNGMSGRISLYNKPFSLKSLNKVEDRGWVMKIDIDGGEGELFKKLTAEQIRKFEEIIIETKNTEVIKTIENSGFNIRTAAPIFSSWESITYAVRR